MTTKCPNSMRFVAVVGLAMLAAVPAAVSQQMLCVLAAKHQIDLKGNDILTDSFDSRSLWKSYYGRYDPSVYVGSRGDVASNDGLVSTIAVGNAEIYGKLHTGTNGTVTLGSQGWVGPHPKGAAGGYQPGWVLLDATNITFPTVSLPYSSGLPLGGPQTIVMVTDDISQTMTSSTVYPDPAPWSGVTQGFVTTPLTTSIYPNPGSYVGSVTTNYPGEGSTNGMTFTYNFILGTNYTYAVYYTNAFYTTNHYDHVISTGDYYTIDALHGSAIVMGEARLVMPNGLSMGGADKIIIAPGGSLKLFVGGTACTVGGNGVLNLAGYAEDFILECTDSVTTFAFNSNAEFIGVLVAPNADMSMNGAGSANNDFIGAVMMNSVTMNGHFSFHYDEALTRLPGSPPWITHQPLSQIVTVGQPATFIVSATGALPLGYRWRFAGTDIPNATNSSFTIPNAIPSDAGSYSVIVTNAFGSAVSSNALLTLIVPPTLALELWAGYPLLNLSGMLSSNFVVQYSTNLAGTNWTHLLSLSNLAVSPYLFLDPAGYGDAARFYRAFMQ